MTKADVLARLKEIIIDRLDVEEDQIRPEASFVEDLGADSLDIVELIMGIEEEFDIEIPDEDAEKLTTVGEAINYACSKLGIEAEFPHFCRRESAEDSLRFSRFQALTDEQSKSSILQQHKTIAHAAQGDLRNES